MVNKWAILTLAAACISSEISAQSTETANKAKSAPRPAEIAKFFIDEPKKDSPYETGPLHIVYSDGTESVQTLPPYKASTEKEMVYNEAGFSGVQLAADRQTLGWTIDLDNANAYPVALFVVVFRHHKVLHAFEPGLTVWDWMFLESGKQVAVVSGPLHGPGAGEYRLYDVQTGKLMSKVFGDDKTEALKRDEPAWAKLLQDHLHKR